MNVKENKSIIIIVLILILLIGFILFFYPSSSDSSDIINKTNNQMESIDSYSIEKEMNIYENSENIANQDLNADVDKSSNEFIINKTNEEHGDSITYRKYGNKSYVYTESDDYWFISAEENDTLDDPIGFYNSFILNNTYFDLNTNLLSDEYTLTSKITDEDARKIAEWSILDRRFPNMNTYDDVAVSIEVKENYKINKIYLNWNLNNRNYEITYDFVDYNYNPTIEKPIQNDTRIWDEEVNDTDIDLSADLDITQMNDRIDITINEYSEDVSNIYVNPNQKDELLIDPQETDTITLTEGYDFAETDRVIIGVMSDETNEYRKIESINHNLD